MQSESTSSRFVDAFLPLGMATDQLQVALTGADLTHHVAILGTVAGRAWEDVMVMEQVRQGGGFVVFDLWPTPQRQNQFARSLHAANRGRDLYVIDLARPEQSDRWSPTVAGTVEEVVTKLMALCPPATGAADREELAKALHMVVASLREARARFTLSDVAVLLHSGKALSDMCEGLPVGAQRQKLTQWLRILGGTPNETQAELSRIAGRYVARLDAITEASGSHVLNTALPTLDVSALMAAGKCLYVPVLRHDEASSALARMLCVEIQQALAHPNATPQTTPYLLFMGDLGRAIPIARGLVEQATAAGVGLVLTMSGDEATTDGVGFTTALLKSARTQIICGGNSMALNSVAGFLGQDDKTSILMRNNTMQLLVRPEAPSAPVVETLQQKHLPLGLAPGETILDFDRRFNDVSTGSEDRTTFAMPAMSMTAH